MAATGPCRLALVLFALSGCKSMAERDFETRHPECSAIEVTETKRDGYWRTRATGCGHSEDRISWDHANWVQPANAQTEAAFATNCPVEQTSYEVLSPLTIGVTACGQKLVYKALGSRWVLNSDSSPPSSAP